MITDEALMGPESHFWPIYGWPKCDQYTDSLVGDGTCDEATCGDKEQIEFYITQKYFLTLSIFRN